jgi:hypothetical protein
MGLAYGDLKPKNIVIFRVQETKNNIATIDNYCYKIKLIDLGGVTVLNDNKEFYLKTD